MTELSPKSDDTKFHEISQDAKNTFEKQRNFEAHDILVITNTVQCKSYYNYADPGHTHSRCGFVLPGASGRDVHGA